MCLPLFKIYKLAGSMALSKHVTHYGPWSGFLYYNLTTSHREGTLSPTWGHAVG